MGAGELRRRAGRLQGGLGRTDKQRLRRKLSGDKRDEPSDARARKTHADPERQKEKTILNQLFIIIGQNHKLSDQRPEYR